MPQNVQGVVSALFVQNSSAADQLGTQGIRLNAMSDYGLEVSMFRWLNGDMDNGIAYADPGESTTQQTYAVAVLGGLLIPTYGLTGGDIVLQVNSTAARTRTFTPVITANVGARQRAEVVQTESAPTNVRKQILKGSLYLVSMETN